MSAKRNLVGQNFGKLLVLEEETGNFKKRNRRGVTWKCQCICGQITYLQTATLISGHSKSCGCGELENKRNNCNKGRILRSQARKDPKLQLAKWIFNKNYADGDLQFDEFYIMSQQNCFYCNSEPLNDLKFCSKIYTEEYKNASRFIYNGLDRVNNNLPHNKNNVVPCCKHCNFSKRNRDYNEFVRWIEKVYFNLKQKNLTQDDTAYNLITLKM